jgi:hypothetical protein
MLEFEGIPYRLDDWIMMSVFELADDRCEILIVCWSTITEIPK